MVGATISIIANADADTILINILFLISPLKIDCAARNTINAFNIYLMKRLIISLKLFINIYIYIYKIIN
jgi:hypothetical protein